MLDFVNVDEDAYRAMLQAAEKEKRKKEFGGKKEFGQERAGKKILSTAWEGQSKDISH